MTAGTANSALMLPDEHKVAHHLCFQHHDIMVELLRSAEQYRVFFHKIELEDGAARSAFEAADDVLEFIERAGRLNDRMEVLRRTVFPAVLSDMLLFIYEALSAAGKGKLSVSFALLRKPIQENLCLLEMIAADPWDFATKLATEPLKLRSQKQGGVPPHGRRVSNVLSVIPHADRFDSDYIAQLRYAKAAEDSFDGVCNHAMHLFTEHKALRTERMNINFIFSDDRARATQWAYLYSRLPYLLDYIRQVVEYICEQFERTDPLYVADMERRIMAGTALWWVEVAEAYQGEQLESYAQTVWRELEEAFRSSGLDQPPTAQELSALRDSGALPGEGRLRVRLRAVRYHLLSRLHGVPALYRAVRRALQSLDDLR